MSTQLEINFFDFDEPTSPANVPPLEPVEKCESVDNQSSNADTIEEDSASTITCTEENEPVSMPPTIVEIVRGDTEIVHVSKPVVKTRDRILEAMLANPKITVQMLQQQLGMSRRGLEDSIARMKKADIIRRHGSDTKGRWFVVGSRRRSHSDAE